MEKNKKVIIMLILIVLSLGVGLFCLNYEKQYTMECFDVEGEEGLQICE